MGVPFLGRFLFTAVGLAVLDVFENEKLMSNSKRTGLYMHEQLHALANEHDLIGDIRGRGLFAGVELVLNGDPDAPASNAARHVVNTMRESGVLISMIGPNANVLKVRPPLPFQPRHVDRLIDKLDGCLKSAKEQRAA